MPALFDIPDIPSREADSALVAKSGTKKKSTISSKGNDSISKRISRIISTVEQNLGKYADEMDIIYGDEEDKLSRYIDASIDCGIIAIDTETTGLNPLHDKLVGVGLYTPGEKAIYIPVNHVSYVTGVRVKNQMTEETVGHHMERLAVAGVKIVMFNAVFDTRVLKHSAGVTLECWWDCSLASRCLNENEPKIKGSKGLKKLHQKYVLRGEEDAYSFDDLFDNLNFALVPVKTAYLYAAHDPKITYEYYDYQKDYLRLDSEREDMRNVAWVFFNIEMPCVAATAELEDTGIEFDFEYNEFLKKKYHALLDEKEKEFQRQYKAYSDEIAQYRGKVRLDDPININSVPQLQVLLYDIIGLDAPIDKKTKKPKRGTGEEFLKKLKHPVADAILAYREFSTIVGTFIDKLPECVDPDDNRIHCSFHQYGADTGRFSSSDPNMQNIPSKNHDIRKMFKAHSDEYTVSTDTDYLELKRFTEVETPNGWVYSDKLKIGDELLMVDDDGESVYSIDDIKILPDKVIIKLFDCSQ